MRELHNVPEEEPWYVWYPHPLYPFLVDLQASYIVEAFMLRRV